MNSTDTSAPVIEIVLAFAVENPSVLDQLGEITTAVTTALSGVLATYGLTSVMPTLSESSATAGEQGEQSITESDSLSALAWTTLKH